MLSITKIDSGERSRQPLAKKTKQWIILGHYYDIDETDGVTSLQPMKYVDGTNAIIKIEYIPREQRGKMLINYKLPQISPNVCTWEYTKMCSEEE